MSKFFLALILVPVLLAGCGEAETSTGPGSEQAALKRQVEQRRAAAHRAKMRQRARAAARRHHRQVVARRHRAQARAEKAQRQEAEQRQAAEEAAAAELVAEEEAAVEEEASECDPNYSGACLDPSAYDYDCEGGSGDGPEYTGTVSVVGEDHYGLDADSDGTGCEPY
ncbi:MAG TPA: hypothetical protein VKB23_08365 [Solirubrobacterales bacterium]|nr:hypothetical protein [Solirubrobacterales bacterium]